VNTQEQSRLKIVRERVVRCGTLRRMLPVLICMAYCLSISDAFAATKEELQHRRANAVKVFHDGILLVHSRSSIGYTDDSFRQDGNFYYLTGLENTAGAVLALDGASGESWLFLSSDNIFRGLVAASEVSAGPESAKQLGMDHVVSAESLPAFLSERTKQATKLYYEVPRLELPELPSSMMTQQPQSSEPTWIAVIAERWPLLHPEIANKQLDALRAVQSPSEMQEVRKAANASVSAVIAGMHAIGPGISQRRAELAVDDACWEANAHGVSFYPWVMSGENSILPKPLVSIVQYDQLNTEMKAGDLARLDIGCESNHYGGDLGRTIPVSGHFSIEQRETWNIFVAAYLATAKTLREGVTSERLFATWRAELLKHRETVKTDLARRAIVRWIDKKNVPFWEVHLMNLQAGGVDGPLQAGATIDFEPIVDVDGQGYYLEDMYLVKKDGAELLTPDVPYTAEDIEATMQRRPTIRRAVNIEPKRRLARK
jgi:Xaa-Pro aminopeptidase